MLASVQPYCVSTFSYEEMELTSSTVSDGSKKVVL